VRQVFVWQKCDSNADDTKDFGANDVEEFLSRLVRVSVWVKFKQSSPQLTREVLVKPAVTEDVAKHQTLRVS
jgi:hypothetical protein